MRWVLTVIAILLLIAYPFRWEKGPTQRDGNITVVHKRDRWTGQAWLVLYGRIENDFYSGEERPIPSTNRLQTYKKQVSSSDDIIQKKTELEQKLEEQKKKRWENVPGYNKYELVEEETRKQFKSEHGEYIAAGYDFFDDQLSPTEQRFVNEVEAKLDKNIIAQHKTYLETEKAIRDIKKEMDNLPKSIDSLAMQKFSDDAYRKRKTIDGIWLSLVIFSFLGAGIGFIRRKLNLNRTSQEAEPKIKDL